MPDTQREPSIFRPGANCWRTARAKRLAVLVDGEEYFGAFAAAAERAERSILILAWDFNSRTALRVSPHGESLVLGEFLNSLARKHPRLEVRVLIWDYPMIFGTDREFPPIYGLGWKPHRRVKLRYDNTHPVAACHHQKIAVIDDRVAFCGGLDLTVKHWDTREHRAGDPRRSEAGHAYPPFHDIMMMVDGDAARRSRRSGARTLGTGDRDGHCGPLPRARIPGRRRSRHSSTMSRSRSRAPSRRVRIAKRCARSRACTST